jgi:hypothetical protein
MSSWVRTVMMWLLMAALPVQSWAIATMAHCAPSHQRMAAGSDHGSGHRAGHDAHAGHEGAAHRHAEANPVDVHATADADGTPTEADALNLAKFKCSACATCGLGLALPSTTVTFDASVSPDTLQPGMPQGHAVFLTAGPERPPRSFLA